MLPAAAVIPVRPGGQLLLQLRDDRPGLAYRGRWSTLGGAVEVGETPVQAARRELLEEIGRPPQTLYVVGTVDGRHFRSHLFATPACWSLDDLILGEGQGVDWLSPAVVRRLPLLEGLGQGILNFLTSSVYHDLAAGEPTPAPPLAPLPAELPQLLGLRRGQLLAVHGASAGFVRRLWDLLDDVRVTASPGAEERPRTLLWWPRGASLLPQLAAWRPRLPDGGAVWLVVPAASGGEAAITAAAAGFWVAISAPFPAGEVAICLRPIA